MAVARPVPGDVVRAFGVVGESIGRAEVAGDLIDRAGDLRIRSALAQPAAVARTERPVPLLTSSPAWA